MISAKNTYCFRKHSSAECVYSRIHLSFTNMKTILIIALAFVLASCSQTTQSNPQDEWSLGVYHTEHGILRALTRDTISLNVAGTTYDGKDSVIGTDNYFSYAIDTLGTILHLHIAAVGKAIPDSMKYGVLVNYHIVGIDSGLWFDGQMFKHGFQCYLAVNRDKAVYIGSSSIPPNVDSTYIK